MSKLGQSEKRKAKGENRVTAADILSTTDRIQIVARYLEARSRGIRIAEFCQGLADGDNIHVHPQTIYAWRDRYGRAEQLQLANRNSQIKE